MNSKRVSSWRVSALVAAAMLAGCASGVKLDTEAPVESRTATVVGAGTGGAGASSSGTSQTAVTPVDLTKSTSAATSNLARVIYFDYDSFVVKSEFQPAVEAHAKALATDRGRKLSIEGHTDDRGGREYNLALGQKRAEAVVKSLTLLGASAAQVEAVSFGKERPAATGSDEAAFAKNRRVELNSR